MELSQSLFHGAGPAYLAATFIAAISNVRMRSDNRETHTIPLSVRKSDTPPWLAFVTMLLQLAIKCVTRDAQQCRRFAAISLRKLKCPLNGHLL